MSLLTEDNKNLLDASVEKYLAQNYAFDRRQKLVASEVGYGDANWQTFADLGWLAIPFPEDQGGVGGDVYDTLRLMNAFGKWLVVEPFVSSVGLVGQAIGLSSNKALKESVLTEIIAGQAIACLASEEQDSRGNPCNVSLTAEKKADAYRLKGSKVAVMNAPQARYILLSARTGGEQCERQGVSLFLIDADSDGVALTSYPTVDGHRAANIQVDLMVPASQMLTAEGEGSALLEQVVHQGLVMLCAEAVGIMKSLLDDTIEYTSARKQFGMPLAAFQVLRHRMANMYIAYESASCLLTKTLSDIEAADKPMSAIVSALKVQTNQSGRYIGDSAIQLHGGIGMTDELKVGHSVKRLIAINMILGNSDYHLKQLWSSL